LRPFVERLVTLAKRGDLHARRIAISRVRDVEQVGKLFGTLDPATPRAPAATSACSRPAFVTATTRRWR